MSRSRLNLAVLALIPIFALLLGSCGADGASAERTVGPIGPTISGYYFEHSLSPSIIKAGQKSTVLEKITVRDAAGSPVAGVDVRDFAAESVTVVTDANGMAFVYWEVDAGDITGPLYTHASVEDLELTNYVVIIP